MKRADGKQEDIRNLVAGTVGAEKERTDRLSVVVKCLVTLARQGMALRAHQDDKLIMSDAFSHVNKKGEIIINAEEINRGNFITLLKFRADSGDKMMYAIANKKNQYYSPVIQNELLADIAAQVLNSIVQDIGCKPFTIIADETTDSSNKEQLCLAVRYVTSASDIVEKFISLESISSLKGKGMPLDRCA